MSPEFTPVYEASLALVQALIEIDPDPATPEGELLAGLAAAIEKYEKAEFPLDRVGEP